MPLSFLTVPTFLQGNLPMEEQQTGRWKTVRWPSSPVRVTLLPKRNLAVYSSTWSGGRLWKSPERGRAGGTAVYFFSKGMKSRYWICSITRPTPTEWRQASTSRDRKSVVEGKRVDIRGGGQIEK